MNSGHGRSPDTQLRMEAANWRGIFLPIRGTSGRNRGFRGWGWSHTLAIPGLDDSPFEGSGKLTRIGIDATVSLAGRGALARRVEQPLPALLDASVDALDGFLMPESLQFLLRGAGTPAIQASWCRFHRGTAFLHEQPEINQECRAGLH